MIGNHVEHKESKTYQPLRFSLLSKSLNRRVMSKRVLSNKENKKNDVDLRLWKKENVYIYREP